MEEYKIPKKGVVAKLVIMFFSLIVAVGLAVLAFWIFDLQYLCALSGGFMCFLDNPYIK